MEPREIPTPDQPPTFPPIGGRTLTQYLTVYEGAFTEVGLRAHWQELMGINAAGGAAAPGPTSITQQMLAKPAVGTPEIFDHAVGTLQLADAAVTDDKITSVAYAKVTGVPNFMVVGAEAGGDLMGLFPSPLIAPNAVGDTEIVNVSGAKLLDLSVTLQKLETPVQARLPPVPTLPTDYGRVLTVDPGTGLLTWLPPTGGGGSGTGLWTTAGTGVITPSPDATVLLSPLTTPLQFGKVTLQSRFVSINDGTMDWRVNLNSSGVKDDPTRPSWILAFDYQNLRFRISHIPYNAVAPYTVDNLFVLSEEGNVTLRGTVIVATPQGATPVPGMIQYNSVSDHFQGYKSGAWFNLDDVGTGGSSSWTDDGTNLIPYPPSRFVFASSGLVVPISENAIVVGSAAAKVRFNSEDTIPQYGFLSVNHNAVTGAQDTTSQSTWILGLGGSLDQLYLGRKAPGNPTLVSVFTVSSVGKVTAGADPTAALDLATKQYVDARASTWTDLGTALQPVKGQSYAVNTGLLTVRTSAVVQGPTDGSTTAGLQLNSYYNSPTIASQLYFYRGRSGPAGAQVGDSLGAISWAGRNSTGSSSYGAQITAIALDTFVTGVGGTRLMFQTVPVGSMTLTERLSINGDGTIRATVDPVNALDLATKQYVDAKVGIWVDSGSVLTPAKGATYPVNHGNLIVRYQLNVEGAADGSNMGNLAISDHNGSPSVCPLFAFMRSRPSLGVVLSGDRLGQLAWAGLSDGTTSRIGAALTAKAIENFSATGIGTQLSFWTTPAGTVNALECMILDSAGALTIPGPTSGVARSQVKVGTRTQKGRLYAMDGYDRTGLMHNLEFDGSNWVRDDTAARGWLLQLSGDQDQMTLAQVTPAGVYEGRFAVTAGGGLLVSAAGGRTLLTLNSAGRMIAPGGIDTTDQSSVIFGGRTIKGRLTSLWGYDWVGITSNNRYDGSSWLQDDGNRPAWRMLVRSDTADCFQVERQPIGGGPANVWCKLDSAGVFSASGGLGLNMTPYTYAQGTVSANVSTTTTDTQFASVSPACNGRTCLILLSACLAVGLSTTGQYIIITLKKGGTPIAYFEYHMGGGAFMEMPLPVSISWVDWQVAGTPNYTVSMYSSNAGLNVHTAGTYPGRLFAVVFN